MRKHRIQKDINEYLQNNCIKKAQDLVNIEEILNNDEIELPNNVVINRNGICSEEFIKWYTLLQYPKTYMECCEVVNASPYVQLVYDINDGQKYSYDIDNLQIYENIRKLKICCDAYWKIAGEQMGLGKPWEPDWTNYNEFKFVIGVLENEIIKCYNTIAQYTLAFPTEEMRDAFFENFKELIKHCKELL